MSSGEAPLVGPRRPDRWIGLKALRVPVGAWMAAAAIALFVQYQARVAVQPTKSTRFLDGWIQFDGPEYLSIAAEGYQQRQLVWFPVYPALFGAVDLLLRSPRAAAVGVSMLGGLLSAVLFWVWSDTRSMTIRSRVLALAVLLTYPYGWFLYGVVYPDAIFLALVLAAFVMIERRQLWWGVLFGAIATAARPSGFAVGLGLWVLWLERSGALYVVADPRLWRSKLRLPTLLDRSSLSLRSFAPLLSMSGLLLYMGYQWAVWGSPLRFVTEQANYHEQGTSSLLKQQYFDAFSLGFDARHLTTTTAQAILLVVVLGTVPAVGRRFGWGYAVFVFGLALLPMVSVSTFMGVGRYLLPAFPAFALAGEWLSQRRRPVVVAWFTISATALALLVFGFSRSWYLT